MPPANATQPRHRRLVVLRGTLAATRHRAESMVAGLARDAVLWVGSADDDHAGLMLRGRELETVLGQAFDAVILDAHEGIDADHLGLAHGLAWGGGVFVLRLPERECPFSPRARASLAAHPHSDDDVGRRFETHLARALARAEVSPSTVVPPPSHAVCGHEEQERVVDAMHRTWETSGPSRFVLTADRGRGKSSALGLAIARLLERTDRRVAVTAAGSPSVREVFRFAVRDRDFADRVQFVPATSLVMERRDFDLIVVDEAAQLPVPLLRRLVEQHPRAHLALCTTTHGYEGTGRGFSLRFVAWLETRGVPVARLHLHQPIRWDAEDPVERFVFGALLLDAEFADVSRVGPSASEVRSEQIDRDQLVEDEPRLRELFGLLVHAHYRTTPKDLHRMLDAPNLELHASSRNDRIVAATIVAREGGLEPALCEEVARGRTRLRAHALADILVAHLGKPAAGQLSMIRSVRIATHPELRREGVATALVEHVHASYRPDLFGTIFGATAELIAFRRSLGYEVVRISASRGARTGEPSVMMLRPVSDAASALMTELRREFARDLAVQLELLEADGQTLLDPELVRALQAHLPSAAALSSEEARALAVSYAHGPRTFESVALAARVFVREDEQRLAELPEDLRAVVEARVMRGQGWRGVAEASGQPSVPAAMRALRRAFRLLIAEP